MKWKFEVKLHKVKNAGTILVELIFKAKRKKMKRKYQFEDLFFIQTSEANNIHYVKY